MGSRRYEVRVRGTIPPDVLEELGGDLQVESLTVVTGIVRDQTGLYSVLRRLQSLGMEVVALRVGVNEMGQGPLQ